MSKRIRLAKLLDRVGAVDALLDLRADKSLPWLSVFTYHRFAEPGNQEPFDEGVVDTTNEEFERHVIRLKKHFTPVGVDELCAFAAGKKLPPNPVAITFDDGYLSGYKHAFPILRRHDCKAIYFVPTSFISERRTHWWDRVAYLMKHCELDAIELEYPFRLRIDISERPELAIRCVLRLIKVHQGLDLDLFLEELARATEVPWTRGMDRAFADRLLMTWDQLRALRAAGIDVESHTRTHRVLQTLPLDEVTDDLSGSRKELEREIGEPVRAIAYPIGKPLEATSPIRGALANAGYRIGFTNGTGATPLWRSVDPFDICRHTVDRSYSEAYFRSVLVLPFLASKHPWHLVSQ